jgi:hypothetical protein
MRMLIRATSGNLGEEGAFSLGETVSAIYETNQLGEPTGDFSRPSDEGDRQSKFD